MLLLQLYHNNNHKNIISVEFLLVVALPSSLTLLSSWPFFVVAQFSDSFDDMIYIYVNFTILIKKKLCINMFLEFRCFIYCVCLLDGLANLAKN